MGVGAVLVLLVGVRSFVLPGMVRAKVSQRAERFGLRVDVAGVAVGLDGVDLSGLALQRASDGAPLGSVVQVRVQGGLFGMDTTDITVTEPRVSLEVDDLATLLKGARGKPNLDHLAAQSAPKNRALHVRGLAFSLRDAHGQLLGVEGAQAERAADGHVRYHLDHLRVGAAPHEALDFAGVTGELLGGGTPVFKALDVEHGQLRWASSTAGSAEGRLVPRLKALRAALGRGQAAPTTDMGGSTRSAVQAAVADGRTLWTEDATLSLADINVTEIGEVERPIASQLSLRLQALPQGMFSVAGKGVAPGDGRVSVDLRIDPKSLRTEGDVSLHKVALVLLAPVLPPLPFDNLDQTRVDAALSLSGQGLEAISARGDLALTDLAFASERLAHAPVGPISFTAHGEGTWKPKTRELADLKASLSLGKVRVTTTGSIAWPADGYDVELSLAMPKSGCDDVLRVVPAGLLDELQGVRLSGDVTARIDASIHATHLDDLKLDFDIKDHCRFAEVTSILDVRRFERPFVHRVLEPDDTVFEFETGPGTGTWTPIELISPFMTQAAIAHEDGRFLGHRGFAPKEIGAALARNLKARAFRFGASTITMQLVKNVFLHREKVMARKIQEAFIVWWLEQHWDKKHILELYLNVIEYGPRIYGIRQAALHYFGNTPLDLTPAQASFLASILPNPKGFYENYEKGKLSESMKSRMIKFLEHMRERKRIDDEATKFGIEETQSFAFYDPKKPPPPPRPMRGQAEALPFVQTGSGLPSWDDGMVFQEDGSYR
jgi:hypothetical protein